MHTIRLPLGRFILWRKPQTMRFFLCLLWTLDRMQSATAKFSRIYPPVIVLYIFKHACIIQILIFILSIQHILNLKPFGKFLLIFHQNSTRKVLSVRTLNGIYYFQQPINSFQAHWKNLATFLQTDITLLLANFVILWKWMSSEWHWKCVQFYLKQMDVNLAMSGTSEMKCPASGTN